MIGKLDFNNTTQTISHTLHTKALQHRSMARKSVKISSSTKHQSTQEQQSTQAWHHSSVATRKQSRAEQRGQNTLYIYICICITFVLLKTL